MGIGVTSEGPTWEWGHRGWTNQRYWGWDGDAQFYCLWLSFCLVKATVNATVEMKTKVDNRDFTEELKDMNSAAFKDFEREFKEQVRGQRCRGHPHAGAAPLGGVFRA